MPQISNIELVAYRVPHPSLANGNLAARRGDLVCAMKAYAESLIVQPETSDILIPNVELTRRRYRRQRDGETRLRCGVSAWDLSHNAAGRAHMLASLYNPFSDVRIIGCLESQGDSMMWEPIRQSQFRIQVIDVERWDSFLDSALRFVSGNPLDLVHLSKPRAPNVILGILYKALWGSKVVMDIDDEELGFVGASAPADLGVLYGSGSHLPPLNELIGTEWTRIAVALARTFDGVTVSNTALQTRYGGEVIAHARDERTFNPSEERRRSSRSNLGLPEDKKVVLFFGTPRAHKGLLETATAIAAMNRRDVVFAIVGDFPDPSLKRDLEQVTGVDYLFVGGQPIDATPDIVAVADVCVLMQCTESLASQYQIPAKVSDALAMNVPVIATRTPALEHAASRGALVTTTLNELRPTLERLFDDVCAFKAQAKAGRRYFDKYLSRKANATVLQSMMSALPVASMHQQLRHLAGMLEAKHINLLATSKFN
jgi:glycosyltransferase involved in cell wall biosynthesis